MNDNDLGPTAAAKLQERAKQEAGVLLPEVPPEIGELLLTTIYANPEAPYPEVVAALVLGAKDDTNLCAELVNAAISLAIGRARGELAWLKLASRSILVGVRSYPDRATIKFGASTWPVAALMEGAPKLVRVQTQAGMLPVWTAANLDGAVLRMSEVVALAQMLFEAHGAKVIEDRHGPEAAAESAAESVMGDRARRRAQAKNELNRLLVNPTVNPRAKHARVALAEAIPGLLKLGNVIIPELGLPMPFEVEKRVAEDYVLIVAQDPQGSAGPGGWVYPDRRKIHPEIDQVQVGWTDDEATPRE